MRDAPPEPEGGTYLLSAGPGSGKTQRLKQWADAWGEQARYIQVPAGALGKEGFRARLVACFPEARACFQALTERFPEASWGALLGMALGETSPEACLLLDGLHHAEGSDLHADLLALCRHFPEGGRLAVASRHRLPAIARPGAHSWDVAHPDWAERPSLRDLRALPDPLLGKALALHLLEVSPPSPEGSELVRRNVAHATAHGMHALRAPWRAIAEEALDLPERPAAWDAVAADLEKFARRCARTPEERRLDGAVARLSAGTSAAHAVARRLAALVEKEPLPADAAALRALLDRPARGDRLVHHRHFRALQALWRQAIERRDAAAATAHADRMVHLALRFGFTRDLLAAHTARLDALLLADARPDLSHFLAIPPEAFDETGSLPDYLRCLRDRAAKLGEGGLAMRLGALLRREAPPLPRPADSLSPSLRVRVFGGFALEHHDGTKIQWPRHKTLTLLALLTHHPLGMFADELAETLFGREAGLDPQEALHTVTYAARRTLKTSGWEGLLDTSGGCFRLRWQQIAHCDLREFEAFREGAMLLETKGMAPAAALFREVALACVSGDPFPGLEDELQAECRMLAQQVRALQAAQGGGHQGGGHGA